MHNEQTHIDETRLIAYADDPRSDTDSAVAEHVSQCHACGAEVTRHRELTEDLRDEATWWVVERGADLSSTLSDLRRRCEMEDAEAEEILRPVLGSESVFIEANVVQVGRFYTGGVVRLLSEEARKQCVREPRFALILAETAGGIAEALDDDYYPAKAVYGLRGNAWKDYSTGCRYLSRFEDGYNALHRAERAYHAIADPEVHLAVVNVCRASLLFEQERYTEALRCIRSAATVFVQRLERSRYFQAKEVEAIILHNMGDVVSACVTYEEALNLADVIGDVEMKARAARNLGVAYREAGDIDVASRYFLAALQLYQALGAEAMVVHTRWSIARLSLAAGNPGDAAERLPFIISDFIALGIIADAARAQLDLAEASLILGRFEVVEAVCTSLFDFFSRAEMRSGAMTAAAYLKECAISRRVTREDIDAVRKYFPDAKRAPEF